MSQAIDVFALSLMARVYACNARVEAMKAENMRWAILHPDNSPIYTEQDFLNEASEIDSLAEALKGRS